MIFLCYNKIVKFIWRCLPWLIRLQTIASLVVLVLMLVLADVSLRVMASTLSTLTNVFLVVLVQAAVLLMLLLRNNSLYIKRVRLVWTFAIKCKGPFF